MHHLSIALLGLMALGALPAQAQDVSGCAKFKWSVAREQSAFSRGSLPTVESGQPLPGVFAAASVKLQPQSAVTFAHPPGRKPKVDPAYAAVVTLPDLTASGAYQVTLSAEAWIDMLQDGQEVRSSGFSGQPDCPGVRKSVKFALQPGAATIQISGASADSIMVEVLPAE